MSKYRGRYGRAHLCSVVLSHPFSSHTVSVNIKDVHFHKQGQGDYHRRRDRQISQSVF